MDHQTRNSAIMPPNMLKYLRSRRYFSSNDSAWAWFESLPAETQARWMDLAEADILFPAALEKIAAGVRADIDGDLRRCCDCSGWFDGPGPRCPVCVDLRNATGHADDLTLLQRSAAGAIAAIEAALVAIDHGQEFGDKEYESLWDAMIALKNELPKR